MATTSTTSPYTNPQQAETLYIFTFDPSANSSQRTADTTHTIGYLPINFVVTQAWYHVLTTFTSSSDAATIALGYTGAANGFFTATAISSGTTWDAAGPIAATATGSAATMITAASGDAVLATTAASESLITGKVLLCVRGYTTT